MSAIIHGVISQTKTILYYVDKVTDLRITTCNPYLVVSSADDLNIILHCSCSSKFTQVVHENAFLSCFLCTLCNILSAHPFVLSTAPHEFLNNPHSQSHSCVFNFRVKVCKCTVVSVLQICNVYIIVLFCLNK